MLRRRMTRHDTLRPARRCPAVTGRRLCRPARRTPVPSARTGDGGARLGAGSARHRLRPDPAAHHVRSRSAYRCSATRPTRCTTASSAPPASVAPSRPRSRRPPTTYCWPTSRPTRRPRRRHSTPASVAIPDGPAKTKGDQRRRRGRGAMVEPGGGPAAEPGQRRVRQDAGTRRLAAHHGPVPRPVARLHGQARREAADQGRRAGPDHQRGVRVRLPGGQERRCLDGSRPDRPADRGGPVLQREPTAHATARA